jgi:hypothetical protein
VSAPTAWSPPPAPERDLWWHALRISAPGGDYTTRHRRGLVRLPYELNADNLAGQLVEAWVCCDPACGGVELGKWILNQNHGCCWEGFKHRVRPQGRHLACYGMAHFRGFHHGPFTAFWEPDGGVR